jgi:hypothetical protein
MNEADHMLIRDSMVSTYYKGESIVDIVTMWLIKKSYRNVCIYNERFYMIYDVENLNGFFTYNGGFVDVQEFLLKNNECYHEFSIINCVVGINKKYHATVIIINNLTKTLEYYDPHGSIVNMGEDGDNTMIINLFVEEKVNKLSEDLGLIRVIPPLYCGTQTIAGFQNSSVNDIGFCVVHVFLIILFRLKNENNDISEITTEMVRFNSIDINRYMSKLAYILMTLIYQIAQYYGITSLDLSKINDQIHETISLDELYYLMVNNMEPFPLLRYNGIQ